MSHYLASASLSLRLWQIESNSGPVRDTSHSLIAAATPPDKSVLNDVCWTADNKYIVAATSTSLYVHDRAGVIKSIIPAGIQEEVRTVATGNTTARRLYYGGEGRTVRVWDIKDNKAVGALKGHTAAITSIACSADDQRCASASTSADVLIHSLRHGGTTMLSSPFKQCVNKVAFSWSRKSLLGAACDDGSIAIWDVDSKSDPVRHIKDAHNAPVKDFIFAPTLRRMFCSAGLDKMVRCYDTASASAVQTYNVGVPLTCLSMRDDNTFAIGTVQGSVLIYDIRMKGVIISLQHASERHPINAVAFQDVKRVTPKTSTDSLVLNNVPAPKATTARSISESALGRQVPTEKSMRDPLARLQSNAVMSMFSPVKRAASSTSTLDHVKDGMTGTTDHVQDGEQNMPSTGNLKEQQTVREEPPPEPVVVMVLKEADENAKSSVRPVLATTQVPEVIPQKARTVQSLLGGSSIDNMFSPLASRDNRNPLTKYMAGAPTEDRQTTRPSFWDRMSSETGRTRDEEERKEQGSSQKLESSDKLPIQDERQEAEKPTPLTTYDGWMSASTKEDTAEDFLRKQLTQRVAQRLSRTPSFTGDTGPAADPPSAHTDNVHNGVPEPVPSPNRSPRTRKSLSKNDGISIADEQHSSANKIETPAFTTQPPHVKEAPMQTAGGLVGAGDIISTASPPNSGLDMQKHSQFSVDQRSSFQYQVIQNVVNDCLDDFRSQIRADVQNMHLDLIRQFWIQKVG
ncbi:WD40-repeat-containing domain protein [Phlyctochytrium arcticum]|nr:WD40-repeat-containing domain protein [Phlyctochytrium arcticum]